MLMRYGLPPVSPQVSQSSVFGNALGKEGQGQGNDDGKVTAGTQPKEQVQDAGNVDGNTNLNSNANSIIRGPSPRNLTNAFS
jgi:hypothetical protein